MLWGWLENSIIIAKHTEYIANKLLGKSLHVVRVKMREKHRATRPKKITQEKRVRDSRTRILSLRNRLPFLSLYLFHGTGGQWRYAHLRFRFCGIRRAHRLCEILTNEVSFRFFRFGIYKTLVYVDHSKAFRERGNVLVKAKITHAKHSDMSFPHTGQLIRSFLVLEGLSPGFVPLHSKLNATSKTI